MLKLFKDSPLQTLERPSSSSTILMKTTPTVIHLDLLATSATRHEKSINNLIKHNSTSSFMSISSIISPVTANKFEPNSKSRPQSPMQTNVSILDQNYKAINMPSAVSLRSNMVQNFYQNKNKIQPQTYLSSFDNDKMNQLNTQQQQQQQNLNNNSAKNQLIQPQRLLSPSGSTGSNNSSRFNHRNSLGQQQQKKTVSNQFYKQKHFKYPFSLMRPFSLVSKQSQIIRVNSNQPARLNFQQHYFNQFNCTNQSDVPSRDNIRDRILIIRFKCQII